MIVPPQAEPLLHALGEPFDRLLGQAVEAGKAQHAARPLPLGPHQAVRPGVKVQILIDVDIRRRAK